MVFKLKPIWLLVLCFALWSVPLRSQETSGLILGGSLNSPVMIEIFSDFQCGHCRELYLSTIRPVLQEYSSKDKVCIVYHEFPLAMHQYSKEAARYSEAAAQLGRDKLLPVYDSLFTDQAKWAKDGSLEAAVAKAISAEDLAKLKKILQEPGINAAVEREIQLGIQKEINATPTMLISYTGKQQKVEGFVTYTVMKQFLDTIVK